MEENHPHPQPQPIANSLTDVLPCKLNNVLTVTTGTNPCNCYEASEPDVRFITSAGLIIPAHSAILVSVSAVLENILQRPCKHNTIPILGVPYEAVVAFVRFLYHSSCTDSEMDMYGMHLLALSHVFSISKLKQSCIKALVTKLTIENVVDVLQLARLCDAPVLYMRCMKLLSIEFNRVQKTEGWMFLQDHDPVLELEILQLIDESESRKKRMKKNREARNLYIQLSEAMGCLEHICTDGCTHVGPYDIEPSQQKRAPCEKFSTCRGIQLLIRHFATCEKRVGGACSRCKRMWQLLRLHASICDQSDPCKVPLCRQFKLKMQFERKGDEGRWRLLVRKVVSAKAMSTLCLSKRN